MQYENVEWKEKKAYDCRKVACAQVKWEEWKKIISLQGWRMWGKIYAKFRNHVAAIFLACNRIFTFDDFVNMKVCNIFERLGWKYWKY